MALSCAGEVSSRGATRFTYTPDDRVRDFSFFRSSRAIHTAMRPCHGISYRAQICHFANIGNLRTASSNEPLIEKSRSSEKSECVATIQSL